MFPIPPKLRKPNMSNFLYENKNRNCQKYIRYISPIEQAQA